MTTGDQKPTLGTRDERIDVYSKEPKYRPPPSGDKIGSMFQTCVPDSVRPTAELDELVPVRFVVLDRANAYDFRIARRVTLSSHTGVNLAARCLSAHRPHAESRIARY